MENISTILSIILRIVIETLILSCRLQHRRPVRRGVLCQRVDLLQWMDVLAAPGHLPQHLRHRNHLLPLRLSELQPGVQVRQRGLLDIECIKCSTHSLTGINQWSKLIQ